MGAIVGLHEQHDRFTRAPAVEDGKGCQIILLLESTLGDILGVLTVGFLLQYRQPGASVVGDFLTGFFSQILLKAYPF